MASSTSTALIAEGATLTHSTTSGGTYTAYVGKIKSIDRPGTEQQLAEFKSLASLDIQYLPGYKDCGKFTVTFYYTAAALAELIGQQGATTWIKLSWPVELSQTTPAIDNFSVILLGAQVTLDADNKPIEIKCMMQQTSESSFSAGT